MKQSDEKTKWELPSSRRLKCLYFRSEQPGEVHYVGLVIGVKEVAIMARWRTWFSISLQSCRIGWGFFFSQKKGKGIVWVLWMAKNSNVKRIHHKEKHNSSPCVPKRRQTHLTQTGTLKPFLWVTISTVACNLVFCSMNIGSCCLFDWKIVSRHLDDTTWALKDAATLFIKSSIAKQVASHSRALKYFSGWR